MRIFLFLITLILFCPWAKSQDYYNIKYTGKDGVKYDCLLTEDNRAKISIRMRFTKEKITYLVEMKYRSMAIATKAGKEEFLHFKAETMYGSAITFLTKEMLPGFVAPCFIWYAANGKMGTTNPLYVTTDFVNFRDKRKVERCEQISMLEITKGRLKPYFTDGDEDYEAIITTASLNLKAGEELPPLKNSATLHFIMAANTGDPKIGPSCARDEENMLKELKGIAAALGIVLKPYIVNAAIEKDFSRKKLLATIDQVKAAPEDIIIFSYSGHGARWDDQKDPYPFMQMWVTTPYKEDVKNQTEYELLKRIVQLNSVGLSEVNQLINKKGARLNIVLGDMCNTELGAAKPVDLENILNFGDALRNSTEIIRRDPVKLRKLFIEAKGTLLSCAAKPKEKASGNKTAGGYYTASFLEALRLAGTYNMPAATWENIITKTIDQALLYRQNANPDAVQNGMRFLSIKE